MRLKPLFACLASLFLLFHLATAVAQQEPPADSQTSADSEFVPVDLSKKPTVSGKSHTIAAYAIVLSLLFLYGASLFRRERTVKKEIEQLSRSLKKSPK